MAYSIQEVETELNKVIKNFHDNKSIELGTENIWFDSDYQKTYWYLSVSCLFPNGAKRFCHIRIDNSRENSSEQIEESILVILKRNNLI